MPGRFKDYIALPKPNMYQSLHTTVIGPGASASRSRSARTRCTASPSRASPRTGSTRRSTAAASTEGRRALRLAAPADGVPEGPQGPGRVPRERQGRPLPDEVFVFTPKGDVRVFPRGSTPIDFAFAIHSRGRRALHRRARERRDRAAALQAAQRRHRRDPDARRTSSRARTGSTSCVTARARARIRSYPARRAARAQSLAARPRAARARDAQARPLVSASCSRTASSRRAAKELHGRQRRRAVRGSRLRQARARRRSSTRRCRPSTTQAQPTKALRAGAASRRRSARSPARTATTASVIGGIDDVLVRYAKCCNPLPGDADHRLHHARPRRHRAPPRLQARARARSRAPRRVSAGRATRKINAPVQLRVVTADRPGILATVVAPVQRERRQHQRGQLPRARSTAAR